MSSECQIRQGRVANHPFPPTAKEKNKWSFISTPPIRFRVMDKDNFRISIVLYLKDFSSTESNLLWELYKE